MTSPPGSISISSCTCKEGYYPDYANPSLCVQCAQGIACPGNNVVNILPGYWRANDHTAAVVACPDTSISCGGTSSANTTTSLGCNAGYTGPVCAVCEDGYAKQENNCVKCPPTPLNGFAVFVFVVLAIAFAYFPIYSAASVANDATKHNEAGVIVKVMLTYMQCLYYLGRLSANWGRLSQDFFSAVGVVFAMSPNSYNIHCASNWKFYDSLIFAYVSPLIVVTILTITYSIRHIVRGLDVKQSKTDYKRAVLVLLYQIHPTIMLEVINSFPCDAVPGTGTSYLKADFSIDCKSSRYKTFATISALYLVFYIVGMIVLVVFRLRHHHSLSNLESPTDAAYQRFSFFFLGYQRNLYFWESIIMMRKIGIVAFSVLASPPLQLVFGLVIITIASHLNVIYSPYVSATVNRLDTFALAILFSTVVLGELYLFARGDNKWIGVLLIIINTATMAVFLGSCAGMVRAYFRTSSSTTNKEMSNM